MNDHKKLQAKTDFGQKASVHREDFKSEIVTEANRILREVGEHLTPTPSLTYIGSAAVHIYQAPTLGTLFFSSQVKPLGDCPEVTASFAFDELRGTMMEAYGRKRQTKRSGF